MNMLFWTISDISKFDSTDGDAVSRNGYDSSYICSNYYSRNQNSILSKSVPSIVEAPILYISYEALNTITDTDVNNFLYFTKDNTSSAKTLLRQNNKVIELAYVNTSDVFTEDKTITRDLNKWIRYDIIIDRQNATASYYMDGEFLVTYTLSDKVKTAECDSIKFRSYYYTSSQYLFIRNVIVSDEPVIDKHIMNIDGNCENDKITFADAGSYSVVDGILDCCISTDGTVKAVKLSNSKFSVIQDVEDSNSYSYNGTLKDSIFEEFDNIKKGLSVEVIPKDEFI